MAKRPQQHPEAEEPSTSAAPRAAPVFPGRLPALRWQIALAVLAGVLHGFSQPFVIESVGPKPIDPTGLTGLLCFVGYLPLLYVVRDTTRKRAYWLGFAFFVVKYTLVLYWVTVAMTVFGKIPLPLSLIGLMLLAAAVAAPLSGCLAGARMLCERYGLPFWVMLPVVLTGGELIRNYGFMGGFPWGHVGYSLASVPLFLQTAALVGMYGLVFLILVVNTGLTEGLVALRERRPLPKAPLLAAVGILGFMAVYGAVRLADEPTAERSIKVALLQGNIEQGIKNEERLYGPIILERYWDLQARAIQDGAELVVWPEAALPVGQRADATSLRHTKVVPHDGPYAGLLPPSGIIGATASVRVTDPLTGKRVLHRYNTAFATDKDLEVKGRFDKVHLVPFGEYVPWPFSPIVRHLVPGMSTPGDGFHAATIETPKGPLRVGATICYEGAFPEITRAYVDDGAELMFNVTNDAWYGISSMTWQHTLLYAARAVESGRPVARAANTGVSAWVDTKGRVQGESAMYETTYVLADIPLVTEDTLYQKTGDVIAQACVLVGLVLWFYALAGFHFWRRERHPIEWVVGALGVVVGLWTLLDHHVIHPPTHESDSTWNQLQFIFAMLIGLGALSGRPWGRKAQLWVGAGTVVLGAVGIFFSSTAGLVPAGITGAVAVLAYRRKRAYQRPPDVPVAGPYAP